MTYYFLNEDMHAWKSLLECFLVQNKYDFVLYICVMSIHITIYIYRMERPEACRKIQIFFNLKSVNFPS